MAIIKKLAASSEVHNHTLVCERSYQSFGMRWIAACINARYSTRHGGRGCSAYSEEPALGLHALRGKEFVEYDNPFDVGMTGVLGFSSGYHAMMNCDTLLMLGTDFPDQQFYPD